MGDLATVAADAYGRTQHLEDAVAVLSESNRAMIIVDGDRGNIVEANDAAFELFGRPLIGANISRFIPDRYQQAHGAHLKDFKQHPVARPMSAGVDVHAKTKAHGETLARVGLTPIPATHLVIAEIDPLGGSAPA
jgi:PAS domain-containing protein